MPAATNAQVQAYVNERVRPLCQQIRNLYLAAKDAKATIDDIYQNLASSPTWVDTRPDAPPHLLSPDDVLAWNAFITGFITLCDGGTTSDMTNAAAQFPVVRKAVIRGMEF